MLSQENIQAAAIQAATSASYVQNEEPTNNNNNENENNDNADNTDENAPVASNANTTLTGLPAVNHIVQSAVVALRSPSLSPEQASTLERALNDARIILSRDSEATQPWLAAEAAVLNNLGCLLRRINRLSESVQYLQHAVFLEQKAHGKPSPPTLLNLSAACNSMGDTQKACDAALTCMADYAELPPSLRAICLHNLAMCDYHVNQPQVRERVTLLLERAYTEAVTGFGTDHVTTETIYRHLAALTGETSSRNADLAARAMKPLALSASAPSLVRTIDVGEVDVMEGAKFSTGVAGFGGDGKTATTSASGGVTDMTAMGVSSTGVSDKEKVVLEQRLREEADHARAYAAREEEEKAKDELEKAKASAKLAEENRIKKQKELEAEKERQRRHMLRTQYKSGQDVEEGPMAFLRFGGSDVTTRRTITPTVVTAQTAQTAPTASTSSHPLPPPAPISFTHVRQQFRSVSEREKSSRRAVFGEAAQALSAQQQQQQSDSSSTSRISPTRTAGSEQQQQDVATTSPTSAMGLASLRKQQREQHQRDSRYRHLYRSSATGKGGGEDSSGGDGGGGSGEDTEGRFLRETHSLFFDTTLRRKDRREKEVSDDRAYEAATAVRRAREKMEREREERFTALRRRIENRAASLIQIHWRKFQTQKMAHMALTNKAMRQSEDMRRARRVVRFARKWLKRAEGRILLVRLKTRYDQTHVYSAVRKVQCAWRSFASRKLTNHLRQEQTKFLEIRSVYEKKVAAAISIQLWVRRSKCKNAFEKARHDIKGIAASKIQRWFRYHISRDRAAAAAAIRAAKENAAAIKIQAAWRGFSGRVSASMERIKTKMMRMKVKDSRAAQRIQRVGRAYLIRKKWIVPEYLIQQQRHQLEVAKQSSGSFQVLQEAAIRRQVEELEKQQQAEENTNIKRINEKRPRPPTPSRERVLAAQKFQDQSRELYLDQLQHRHQEQIIRDIRRPAPSDYDKLWAVEQLARSRDFSNKRRNTCAIVIQRWWRLYRRPVLENHRSLYESKSAARKIASVDEKYRREKLRQKNDLAKPVREMKKQLEDEIASEFNLEEQEQEQQKNTAASPINVDTPAAAAASSNSPKVNTNENQSYDYDSKFEEKRSIQTTKGSADNMFQEWHEKVRGDSEKYARQLELSKTKKLIREEAAYQSEMQTKSRFIE